MGTVGAEDIIPMLCAFLKAWFCISFSLVDWSTCQRLESTRSVLGVYLV